MPPRDTEGYLAKYPPHLSFTSEEESRGQAELRKMGVPPGSPFVCFLARDSSYLSAMHPKRDWSYHDYRDGDIENYLAAANEMAGRGYHALRVGAVVGKSLADLSPGVLDYASNHRTDFMDIYLSASCRFFLTSGAGIDTVARIFRRPIAYVDAIPLEFIATWGPDDLIIPRRLWKRDEERFMTFREILDSGIGRYMEQEQYDRHGLEPVHNTPEEIQALAMEMDERLNGAWRTTDEDEELQKRFWSLFKPSELNGVFLSRIGTEFLRQNRDLLN
jgi:putative glycosyltransferase (TIGR04372 family)